MVNQPDTQSNTPFDDNYLQALYKTHVGSQLPPPAWHTKLMRTLRDEMVRDEMVQEEVAHEIAKEVGRLKVLINRLLKRNGDLLLRINELEMQLTTLETIAASILMPDEWIPVSERLPAVEVPYLSPRVEAIVRNVAANDSGRWYLYLNGAEVTHWRPMHSTEHQIGES